MKAPTVEEAKKLAAGPYAEQLLWVLFAYAVPLSWATAVTSGGPVVTNGTAFFLQTPRTLMGITAAHVVTAHLRQKEITPHTVCHLGDIEFDLAEALIDHGDRPDITTFRVTEKLLANLKKQPITGWPPTVPTPGKGILYAGYPGLQRQQVERREFSFGLYGANNVAHSVDGEKITAMVHHDRVVSTIGQKPPPEYDIGGMSGGPLATIIESPTGLISWRLGGVISQGLTMADILYAARADAIQDDGCVRR